MCCGRRTCESDSPHIWLAFKTNSSSVFCSTMCQFVTRNHDPHRKKESFRLHFSLLVKWPKNWIIPGTMQMGKANDHYNYASLKFRWKRWSPYFVTSINMVILTFTPPVLHSLVLYFLLWETWKHRSCLEARSHKKKKNARRHARDTHCGTDTLVLFR